MSRKNRSSACFDQSIVKLVTIEHRLAVDPNLAYTKGLFLIRNCGFQFFLGKDGKVSVTSGADITALTDIESLCRRACHTLDSFLHRISATEQSVLQEFWEAIVYRGILNTAVLDPGIRHIQAVRFFLKIADDLGSRIGSHIDAAPEIALFAKHKICLKIAHALFLCDLMHALSLVLLIALADIRDPDILESKSEKQA